MSSEIEDDEEGATQMMSSKSLVGDATSDALDEEEGDLTVPFDRGMAFAQAARPRPAAGLPAAPGAGSAGGRSPDAAQRQSPAMAPPRGLPLPAIAPSAPARPLSNEATTPQRRLTGAMTPEPIEPDLGTGSITVPVVRDELPLPRLNEFGDTGEMTVPRGLAPRAPEPRGVPKYDLPPPAYKPPPPPGQAGQMGSRPGSVPPPAPYMQGHAQAPMQGHAQAPMQGHAQAPVQGQGGSRPGSIPPGYIQSSTVPFPGLAQAPTPPPQGQGHSLAQMATPPPQGQGHSLAQMATPPPQGPMSVAAPSVPAPSLPSAKLRSPPVFIAVMVACTVLTVTGLLLLVYLKVKHFW